jgi:hypothetical protein
MRSINGLLAFVAIGIASQVLASDPPAAPTKNASPVSTTAPPAATSTSASASVAATSGGGTESQIKTLRASGYKPETHNGQTLWCRHEAQVGTRFEKKTCGTADDLEQQTKESQDMVTRVQQKNVFNPKSN